MNSKDSQDPLHSPSTIKSSPHYSTDFINPMALQQIHNSINTIPRPVTPSDLPPVGIFWDYENVRPPKSCDNFGNSDKSIEFF